MKLKTRKAHVCVEVGGEAWKLTLSSAGALTMRQKHGRRNVTFLAAELVRKAKQLRDGSLCL